MKNLEENDGDYGIYSPYQYRIYLALSLAILAAGIFGVLSISYQLWGNRNINPSTAIGAMLALCFGSLLFFDAQKSLLIVSSAGIEYRRVGYKIFVKWNDVKKVELRMRRRPEYVLVLRKSALEANRVNRFLLGITHSDLIIPLNVFRLNWHQTTLGDLIQRHAPQIELPA